VCLSNGYIITDYFNILIVFWAEFSDQVDEYNLHKKDPVLLGDVLRAVTSVHARFLPTHLSGQTHICKWSCSTWKQVTSKHAERTLWLVAATKLVCSLLPGLLMWVAAIRRHAEIIRNKGCNN